MPVQTLTVERSAEALVISCKGSLLPPVPPLQRGLSLAGLNRACSLPGKYFYHPSTSMRSSSSLHSSMFSSSVRSSTRPPTPCRCLCSSLCLAWNRANIPLPSTVCACVKNPLQQLPGVLYSSVCRVRLGTLGCTEGAIPLPPSPSLLLLLPFESHI